MKSIALPIRLLAIVACLLVLGRLNGNTASKDRIGCRSDSIVWDGLVRTYFIHIPPSWNKAKPMPLVLVIHGGGGTAENTVKLMRGGFNTLADKEGFIVVYPEGTRHRGRIKTRWNDGRDAGYSQADDVGFISALIERLALDLNIDRSRVYATGISNGAHMSMRLARELSDKIAAVAPVAYSMPERFASLSVSKSPISVLVMTGTEDPFVAWDGGGAPDSTGNRMLGELLSVPETVKMLVARNQCSATPLITREPDKDTQDGTRVLKEVYGKGKDGAEVVLYVIEGGGHAWPGGRQYLPERFIGKTSRDIDANEILWNFFKRHALAGAAGSETSFSKEPISTLVPENAGRLSWSHANNLIAHCRLGDDEYFDLWVMKPDGSDAVCLTHGKLGIPQLHNGQPAWHTGGRWIVFQSQSPDLPHNRWVDRNLAEPGHGKHNELWTTDRSGSKFYRLREIAENEWLLHAHFSHDGRQLVWSEKVGDEGVDWAVMLADFVDEPAPRLENIRQLQPVGRAWYEVHGFSCDDSRILMTIGGFFAGYDIWEYVLASKRLVRLTNSPDVWDEHAHYSPDGRRIVWISSQGYKYNPKRWGKTLRTDLWIMNSDGTGQKRVTHFNEPGFAEHTGKRYIMSDNDWSPDGRFVAATVRAPDEGASSTRIVLIDVDRALGTRRR